MLPGEDSLPEFRANVDPRLIGHVESIRPANSNSSHMTWIRANRYPLPVRVKQLAFLPLKGSDEVVLE